MQWTREQYIDLMTFKLGTPMFCELFGPLIGLPEEWKNQGASEEELNMTAFDWDFVPTVGVGGHCHAFNAPPPVLIEETDEYRIQMDFLGRRNKLCKATATIPLPLNFPVKTMDDWLKLKHYYEFTENRIDSDQIEKAKTAQSQGALTRIGIPGGWDMLRELMGEEEACLACYTQPEVVEDIISTVQDTSLKVLERITDKITVDQLSVHEDMAGKSGPMVGPTQILEFFKPYFRSCWDLVSSRGTKLFDIDSDGNMESVLDALIECGINSFHPCEPAAGMDMVALRKQYGNQLAIKGGIDKHVLRGSKADIDKELEYKLQPLMREGGTVFGLDHRIPNGTPLENYRYYVKKGREILGLPPLDGTRKGWRRMAF